MSNRTKRVIQHFNCEIHKGTCSLPKYAMRNPDEMPIDAAIRAIERKSGFLECATQICHQTGCQTTYKVTLGRGWNPGCSPAVEVFVYI